MTEPARLEVVESLDDDVLFNGRKKT